MKALTIRQPYAWLIINAGKDVENRSWQTHFRGTFLIHAAKARSREEYDEARRFFDEQVILQLDPNSHIPEIPDMDELEYGGIIGQAQLVDCVTWYYSPWFTGPNGFILKKARALPFMPITGRLGWFDVKLSEAA